MTTLTDDASAQRQQWILGQAQQQLTAGCMRKFGLRYLEPAAGPAPAAGTVTEDAVGSGPDVTYGVVVAESGSDPEDSYIKSMPRSPRARYQAALFGTVTSQLTLPAGGTVQFAVNGCLSQARARLFGTVSIFVRDFYYPQSIKLKFDAYLSRTRPDQTALTAWRRCMTAAGFGYRSPGSAMAAIDGLSARTGESEQALQARQHVVATADVACNRRSGLRLREHRALAAYVRGLVGGTLAELREIYGTQQRAYHSAQCDLRVRCGSP